MSVQSAIRTKLLASAGVTSLVGTRITLKTAPTNYGYPRITLNLINTNTDHHLGGASGLANSRVQVDCWSKTSTQATALGAAVRSALDTYSGTSDGLVIDSCIIEDESDEYEAPTDGSQRGTHRTRIDFSVWHAQSVPSP